MNFFKGLMASCLGTLIAMVLMVLLFIMVIAGLSGDDQVQVKESSILRLKLEGQINEQQVENPLAELNIPGADEQNTGLIELKSAISHAKQDPKIKGIVMEIGQLVTYYATLEELRQSLEDFKESGKWVISYNEVYTEGAYYLASVSDKVYLNPYGDLDFNGLSAGFTSFKKLLDKMEIKPQVFRVGDFKSAVEPFLFEKMSDENRLQLTEMIGSIHATMLSDIAESRDITQLRLKEISDKMLVRNAGDAVAYGLVDSLLYKDQFDELIKSRVGGEVNYIGYNSYRKSYSNYVSTQNEIAVIVAEGTIMPGKSSRSQGIIGADTFVEEIRKARENEKVKAIVLRVNSPGGEPRASDMIWREVQLAKQVKPVIGSMGDLAASGGYYISMGCDTIVAQESTITGSIGIFGIMFDMSEFLNNKIGITFDEVKTGNFGELYTVTRPLTNQEKEIIQEDLNSFYDTFVTKAYEGRNMSEEEILKIAGGRVWTGTQAKANGLIDVLGGINEAIDIAVAKSNVGDDYKVKYYPIQKPFIEELFSQVEENVKVRTMKSELGDYYVWYYQFNQIKTYQGAQARLPFEFTLE